MTKGWKLVFMICAISVGSVSAQNPNINGGSQAGSVASAQQGVANSSANTIEGTFAVPNPRQPFELTSEEAEYIGKLLEHWQSSSEKVKQFACEFKRYDFDSEAVNYRDPKDNRLAAAQLALGNIRYAGPDRGFYETEQHWEFKAPPKEPGGQAEYSPLVIKENEQSAGVPMKEKWLCDGRFIYEFDFAQKILYEDEIPSEMQGAQIINSPIPFLFGARKDDILNRYWVRPIAQSNKDEFWIEAYPKKADDARMYSKVEIVLAREDFLPKAIHAYSPQYDAQKGNFQSRYFLLENREVNNRLAKIKDFLGIFVRPQTPPFAGWKRVNRTALYKEQQAVAPGQTSGQLK